MRREDALKAKGIEVVTLPFANTNVDLPALPKFVYTLFTDRSRQAVLDIGGDDRGALVLGRFVPFIKEEGSYELYYVVNFYRFLTRTPEEALQVLREIEAACGLPFTAVINNSNLGRETTVQWRTIRSSSSGLPRKWKSRRSSPAPSTSWTIIMPKPSRWRSA